jgi:molybdopterin synthase sulfur carrier subunit
MPKLAFTPHLRQHAFSIEPREYPGATVAAVLEQAFAEAPRLRGYLLDDQGRLRQHVALFLNGQPVQDRTWLSDPVAPADELYVFQALSGG